MATQSIPQTVDPYNIPATMSYRQLQEWILFAIMVVNKPAEATWVKLNALLADLPHSGAGPFTKVRSAIRNGTLRSLLEKHKVGQYQRIERAFREAVLLDLDNLTVEALEAVHGIGPKSARMVILYYRPDAECVPLDTHILKFLRQLGHEAPKGTPPAGKRYAELERAFIDEAHRRKITVRELDTLVWKTFANKPYAERRA